MTSAEQAARLAAAQEMIRQEIADYGWHISVLEASGHLPAFAYTIGLWQKFKHPELIVFGLPPETMHYLLNDVAETISAGKKLQEDVDNFEVLEKYPVRFRTVDASNIEDYFGYAITHYGEKKFPAMQLIWTDMEGFYPWQPDYNEQFAFLQPLLDKPIAFKFFEPKQTECFTTRQVLKEGKPILYAHHYAGDDVWEFLNGENETPEDVMVVSLEEIVKLDPTVNELFDLEAGEMASRETKGDKWVREDMPEEGF